MFLAFQMFPEVHLSSFWKIGQLINSWSIYISVFLALHISGRGPHINMSSWFYRVLP